MKQLLAPIAAAALVLMMGSASAAGVFEDFTVNETIVPGSNVLGIGLPNPALVADKLNGGYTERLTVTGVNTFAAQAVADFTGFFKNDGTLSVTSLLNSNELIGGYKIYAVFSASGAITGPNAFQSSNNTFKLYLDTSSDTSFTLTDGVTAPVLAGTGEDQLLASAGPGLTFGTGNLTGPPGAFNIDWGNFALSAFGKTYFVNPDPFYLNVRVNGDYDVLKTTPIGNTVEITGDVSAVFVVPEPTSLALAGLALLALGASTRRKSI